LICPFKNFAVVCIVSTQNALKKRIEEHANASFLRQTIRRALVVLRSVFTDFLNYWTLACHAQWSSLSR